MCVENCDESVMAWCCYDLNNKVPSGVGAIALGTTYTISKVLSLPPAHKAETSFGVG